MGVGGLNHSNATQNQKPLGFAPACSTVLLLFNPLWIWNLGFSAGVFLATLGLLVTLPATIKWFDWFACDRILIYYDCPSTVGFTSTTLCLWCRILPGILLKHHQHSLFICRVENSQRLPPD